jgi:hypothetical protein
MSTLSNARRVVAVVLAATLVSAIGAVATAPAAHAEAPDGSHPQSQSDYQNLLTQLQSTEASTLTDGAASAAADQATTDQPTIDQATVDQATIDQVMALVPQAMYDTDPALAGLIMGVAPVAPPAPVSHSGPIIPGCPAGGAGLLPGYPAPYGLYSPNPTNNWCTPNGNDNFCSFSPDSGLTFDFRAACRQHDLAYRWTPVPSSQRGLVDGQLYLDMKADCARRNWVSRVFCYPRAAIMYLFVLVFGGFAYGTSQWPGYNSPGAAVPLPAPPGCTQPTHAFVYTAGQGDSPRRGSQIYLTGVVRSFSRIYFEFRDAAGTLVATHLTYFAGGNCVVNHEPEFFDVSRLPLGPIAVFATMTRFEDNQTVTQQVASLNVREGGGTTTCNQPTHAWVAFTTGPMPQGTTIYLTGVVRQYTPIVFRIYDQSGALVAVHQTQPARSNCVVHHEPEAFSTSLLSVGTYAVDATYVEWESDRTVTTRVATLIITPPPPPPTGGGGGGGGGDGGGDDGGGGGCPPIPTDAMVPQAGTDLLPNC